MKFYYQGACTMEIRRRAGEATGGGGERTSRAVAAAVGVAVPEAAVAYGDRAPATEHDSYSTAVAYDRRLGF